MSDELTIYFDGKSKRVLRADYVKAKTRQLLDFGYSGLTESEVDRELTMLEGDPNARLTIIGRMIEGDLKP